MNGESRTPEERERARLERERRRMRSSGADRPIDAPNDPQIDRPSPGEPSPAPLRESSPEPPREPPPMPPRKSPPASPTAQPATRTPARPAKSPRRVPSAEGPPGRVGAVNLNARSALIAVVAIAAIAVAWFVISVFQPFAGDGRGEGAVNVQVPRGADVHLIGTVLAANHVVGSARVFAWRASWSGRSKDFKAGYYRFGRGMSYAAAIDLLARGPNAGVTTITVIEGRSRGEIARQAADLGVTGDYLTASKSSAALNPRRYGAPASVESLEGFLFPATYELTGASNVKYLVAQQLRAFKRTIATVDMRYARSKNLTVFDVVTIASLIEREVQVPSERRLVAAVIYNRLKQGIPLGIDATTRFEYNNWTSPITSAQLAKNTPYNTRLRRGLPPGPIGNPGLASLRAAAHPAKVGYLYYVANPCKPGSHSFSSTAAQFQRDVARYQRARQAAGGKQPSGC